MTERRWYCNACGKSLGVRRVPFWAYCRRCGTLNEEPKGIRELTIGQCRDRLAPTVGRRTIARLGLTK